MQRQIILDTETTGLRAEDGHRVIEIGCIEMVNRKLTNKHFHYYLNPEREIDAGALAKHGITQAFLQDKPLFKEISVELIDFIKDAELIIHNAPFDLSFLNYEFSLLNENWLTIQEYCSIIDTLPMARKKHAGMRNTLDALCKRYSVDLSKRKLHGALLDADLLAHVYLAMTGGQGSFFDHLPSDQYAHNKYIKENTIRFERTVQVPLQKATDQEILEHNKFLEKMQDLGKCVWLMCTDKEDPSF